MDKAFIKNLLTLCLEQNLQQMLQNSYRNYHVKGFNSLILSRSNTLTLRLYICKPGETEQNLVIEQDNDKAKKTYRALGMTQSPYQMFEELNC